jgi:hypothetical protein
MQAKLTEEQIIAVQGLLGEPVAVGLTDRAWRARTQLLSMSLIAVAVVGFKLRMSQEVTLFGFNLSGVTDHVVNGTLAVFVIYLLVHFTWLSWESFAERRLRLTGTRVAYVTAGTFGNLNLDYPSDPRQSTLANWLRSSLAGFVAVTTSINALRGALDEQLAAVKHQNQGSTDTPTIVSGALKNTEQLRQDIEAIVTMLQSPRIPASLRRFEKAYLRFQASQSIRWLIIDILIPLGVALFALILLL